MSDQEASAVVRQRARMRDFAAHNPVALIFLGACCYSTGPVLVSAASASGPLLTFWRLWVSTVVMGIAVAVWRVAGGVWPRHDGWRWSALAGLCFGSHQVLFMTAVKATSVTTVALIGTIAPIVTAIAAVPLFGERMGVRFRLWTLLAMAGAGVVVTGATTGPSGDIAGTVMAVGNVVLFGGFFLISKICREQIAVLPFLFGVMATAAVAISVFMVTLGGGVEPIASSDYGYALAIALLPGGLGHFAMTWPLRYVAANVPPVIRLSQPVMSGTMAWFFLGEAIRGSHVLGGALTLAGVAGAMLSPSGRTLPGTSVEEDEPAPELPG